jgi:hypothetical protein
MEFITIITTDKAPYHKANETISVNSQLAELMISKGYAINPKDKVVEEVKATKKTK